MNHEHDEFYQNWGNVKCKNHVDNVTKNVTSASPNKIKLTRRGSTLYKHLRYNNTDKTENELYAGSDSSTSADIINQINTN